jgi:hypothetical protein
MHLREIFQEIRPPVDKILWKDIQAKEGVRDILLKNPHVLVIGTDEQFSLAKCVWESYPGVRLTVVEMSPAVVRAARENVPPGKQVHFLVKDVFAVKVSEVEVSFLPVFRRCGRRK